MSPLAELEVLIMDCQATGASPAHGVVLELAWGVSKRDGLAALQAHWIRLPTGTVVSPTVRRLTGFDESTQSRALAPEEAWERLLTSVGLERPIPAAIHYARFELAFLRDWAARFQEHEAFPIDAVCVHAIARRLYPELPRRSLRALAGFLGYSLALERRSLGHVEATAFIWRRLCGELAERGLTSFADVKGFLTERAPAAPRGKKRRYPLAKERYRALPDVPGVYEFLRSNGDVLYVGKAQSLRKRVTSHFSARSTREHSIEMLTQVSDVRVTPTDSALEAALLENETIKALRPMYNVQLVSSEGACAWFSDADFATVQSSPDAAHGVGPLPSPFALRPLGALIRALSSDAPPTPRDRAWAVGVAEPFAPDPLVFEHGFSEFSRRHFELGVGTRAAVYRAAKTLILAKLPTKASEADPEDTTPTDAAWSLDSKTGGALDLPSDPDGTEPPVEWDRERVVRHLERALVQCYRLLRRARWLCLLYESHVTFCEPESERVQLLRIRDGELSFGPNLEPGAPRSCPRRGTAIDTRKANFDRAKYDRLRILTTELKRIRRDGGDVSVQFSRERRLAGAALDNIFSWV